MPNKATASGADLNFPFMAFSPLDELMSEEIGIESCVPRSIDL
jgi:hypothetical protein